LNNHDVIASLFYTLSISPGARNASFQKIKNKKTLHCGTKSN